jgi:hypothetical protein
MLTVITLSSLLVLSFGDNAAFHSNVAQRSAFGVPILLVRAPFFLTLFCYCLENATITASSLTMLSYVSKADVECRERAAANGQFS